MRTHLTIISADGRSPLNQALVGVLQEWGNAGLAQTVGVIDRSGESTLDADVEFIESSTSSTFKIYDLLTMRVWSAITVVSCRDFIDSSFEEPVIPFELGLLDLLTKSFAANPDIVIRSLTLSIGDTAGSVGSVRPPANFDLHLVHEPTVLADARIAAVPITSETAPLVLALTGLMVGGGFVWMRDPLVGSLRDAPTANALPARVVRTCLRVVNGGRLADDIVVGAFPESGPWSVPPDVTQARSAPIGASPPGGVAEQLVQRAEFRYRPWSAPRQERRAEVGLLRGVGLFFSHFTKVLTGMPGLLLERGKDWLGSKAERVLQDLTFGDNSAIVLRYRPGAPQDDLEVIELLQRAALPDSDFPLADPRPWELLYRTSFGLVDAGELPEGIESPREGPRRLIFVDPRGIGPSPAEPSFELAPVESALLGLPESFHSVGAVDVAGAVALDALLAAYRSGGGDSGVDVRQVKRSERIADENDENSDEEGTAGRHRPGHPKFNQTEYRVVTSFYQGARPDLLGSFADRNQVWHEARAVHTPVAGPWAESGRCDHCGTRFLIGVCFEHVPSGRLIHLGNSCARRNYPPATELDVDRAGIDRLEERWREWKAPQQSSLLWRVGESIENSIATARRELASAVARASEPDPDIKDGEARLRKRVRRSVLLALISLLLAVVGGVLAVFVFAVLSLLYAVVILTATVSAWVLRFAVLTRNIARLQFRLREKDSERVLAMQKASHDARELARLVADRRQFQDWQAIIREIVHAPFGRAEAPDPDVRSINDVSRPQSFLLATSSPTNDQLAEAQLRAKAVTVHKGWLLDIFTTARSLWTDEYRRLRLADEAEDLSPESDNASSESVVASFQGGSLYYPRTDFRRKLGSGNLRAAVIGDRVAAIVDSLADRELDALLSDVHITGPGGALSGCSPEDLLAGLRERPVPMFDADVFGIGNLELRVDNVDRSIQGPEGEVGYVRHDSLGPGRTFTAASWRLDLSPPIQPAGAPKAFLQEQRVSPAGESPV